jgi:Na+-transporting NADH:ubiquinone oxidoreductase subunit NqrB
MTDNSLASGTGGGVECPDLPLSRANDQICREDVATCPTQADSKMMMMIVTIALVPATLCVAL